MMASPSPTPGNNAADIAAAASQPRPDLPKSITLRGLNKPKCIKCGNVARSRCPYQSCKSCCAKAQNPCHIHVLKANATFPEKTPSSSSSLIDQPSTEAAPSGNPHRVASLRQLSSTFSQFNNLQAPRLKRPFTKKDAAAINDWRFSKLKEFKDRIVEAENEAFDRYMQNTNLLEEVFSSKTELEGSSVDESLLSNLNSTVRDNDENSILEEKLSLRSNSVRSDNLRKRLQELVHNGLRKLQTTESNDESKDSNRDSALADLMDKLNKAGNEEDLKSCLELKNQLFNKRLKTVEAPILLQSELISTVEIDQESLDRINSHFSSLEDIEDL